MGKFLALLALLLGVGACSLSPEAVFRSANEGIVQVIGYADGNWKIVDTYGTGFVVDSETGVVATNYHVVDGSASFIVVYSDGTRARARVVHTENRSSDLAFLLPEIKHGEYCIALDETPPPIGSDVYVLGYPMDAEVTFARGIISSGIKSFRVLGDPVYDRRPMIKVSVQIIPGNSGGPILDDEGRAIGIATITIVAPAGYSGFGFAITATDVANEFSEMSGRKPAC
jgi:S1-C subfamily serine protease